ncbi:hypothetical protein ACTQ56_11895, partial [[Clostridium] aminophilum]|uniref:hypothetical protein n=1 Tax=[Clostridium] aminophilum TaxID=1526 RepID=UPI003F96228E
NSDLSEEKVKGALRRCPVPRGYTQRLEPPFLRVAATFIGNFFENPYTTQKKEFGEGHTGLRFEPAKEKEQKRRRYGQH